MDLFKTVIGNSSNVSGFEQTDSSGWKTLRLPQFPDCIETLANDRDAVKDFFPIWNFFLIGDQKNVKSNF